MGNRTMKLEQAFDPHRKFHSGAWMHCRGLKRLHYAEMGNLCECLAQSAEALSSDSPEQHLAAAALVLLPLGGKLVVAERRHVERRKGTERSALDRDFVHGEVNARGTWGSAQNC